MTNQKEVYVVYTNTDLTEGRGKEEVLAICDSLVTAIRLGKGQYIQGGDCPIRNEFIELKNGRWHGPINVLTPTALDILMERGWKIKESAEQKLKNAGLSEEEIKSIKNL